MSELTTKSVLHSRMSCFVEWIAPDPKKIDEIAERADRIRKLITQNASEDSLNIVDTPKSGSFEKKTGLRRHYRGQAEVDGLDVDIPMIVNPKDKDGDTIEDLLSKFEKYAEKSYPGQVKKTKSSIKISFSDNTSFDVVPMLATDKKDEQILIRKNGEKLRTSVQKHNEFVKGRTRKSNEVAGRVKFNECIRLKKWWKEFQADDSYYLGYDSLTGTDNVPPSILVDLLCAFAYDKLGVEKTYAETLAKWCSYLAHVVRNKKPVYFTDYYSIPTLPTGVTWAVLDPVNSTNNIVQSWGTSKVNELAEWFETARDNWQRIIHFNEDGDDNACIEELVELFGTPFKNHCNKED